MRTQSHDCSVHLWRDLITYTQHTFENIFVVDINKFLIVERHFMLTQHIFTNAKLLISHSLAYGHQYIVFVGPQKKKPFASPSHTPPCVYKTINLRGHFYDNSFIYFFFRSSLSSWWLWFLAVAAACKYTARTSGHRHTYNIYIYRYMQCRACAECCWLAVCVRCSSSITGRSTNMLNEKINKKKHSPIDAFTIYALAICIFSTNHSAFL